MEFSEFQNFRSRFDLEPEVNDERQGGLRVQLETIANSSNLILIYRQLTEICQFMYFLHFAKFQSRKDKDNFQTHVP